jgi:GT2 family glycosyltransferase
VVRQRDVHPVEVEARRKMHDEVRPSRPAVIGVQTLLYRTEPRDIERTLEALNNSAVIGKSESMCDGFVVMIGDASPTRVLTDEDLVALRERMTHIDELHYAFFDANVGTSVGHNRMAERLPTADYIITSNPDVVPEPRAIWRMLAAFDDPTVGMVEAKQLPIEHPKDYDAHTGQTSWATTAFAMTPRELFKQLDGFDSNSFFMYCDDVDYSWRVREAGKKVIYLPSAVVFHDKGLTPDGRWMPTAAEKQFSAEAALFLAHKWSRDDIVARILEHFDQAALPHQVEAARKFRRKLRKGLLVPQRDAAHKVGTFEGNFYAKHRFSL